MAYTLPKLTKEQIERCRIITPEFRVSYPHLFEAQAPRPTDKKKFSITMLFDKNKTLVGTSPDRQPRSLMDVIKFAKINVFGPNKEDWPEDLLSPVSDGDAKKYDKKEGHAGHWVIKATSNADQKPGLVDENLKPILEPALFYPGCYARAYLYARVYEYMGKMGVHFIVDHVQKTRDGKSFSSKKAADMVFSPIEVAAVAFDEDDSESEDFR